MGEVVIDNTDDVRKYRGIPVYIATVYYRLVFTAHPQARSPGRPRHFLNNWSCGVHFSHVAESETISCSSQKWNAVFDDYSGSA